MSWPIPPSCCARETGPTPSLYDIADSAHWANKPDIGVVIHRDSLGPEGTTTIKVAKVRYCGVIGTPGEVTGPRWNREATRYERHHEANDDRSGCH